MCFLRVLCLGGIKARLLRQVLCAILAGDRSARGIIGFWCHVHAVGSHIGDTAFLIEFLRGLHGAFGSKAELAGSFLLQGRRDERRRRAAFYRLGFYTCDREAANFHRIQRSRGCPFIRQVKLFKGFAVERIKAGVKINAIGCAQACFNLPIFLWLERFDFQFALTDNTQRNRLHPPCRTRPRQFTPKDRREVKADKIVERAARQIRIDQFGV